MIKSFFFVVLLIFFFFFYKPVSSFFVLIKNSYKCACRFYFSIFFKPEIFFKKNLVTFYFLNKAFYKSFLNFFFKLSYLSFLGFFSRLHMVGLGYRLWSFKNSVVFTVGFNFPVKIPLGNRIIIFQKKYSFIAFSFSKSFLRSFCLLVTQLRKPNPFKSKGVCFSENFILRQKIVTTQNV